MSRSGTPSTFSDEIVKFFVAVDFELDDEIIGFWSGYGDINFGSRDYTGAGNLMSISPIEEHLDIAADGITIVFSGLSDIDEIGFDDDYQFRRCNLYIGSLNNYPTSIQTYKLFSGFIDTISLTDDGETSTATIKAENRLLDLERPRVLHYTDESQKYLYPGTVIDSSHPYYVSPGVTSLPPDECLENIAGVQDKQVKWGTA